MVFKKIKKTLEKLVLTASLAASVALAPVPAAARSSIEIDLNKHAPDHMQWVFRNKSKARAMVFGFDVAFGCLKSGIGSKVNDKGFWSGCAKGVLAGTVMYAGEHIATYTEKYPMAGAAGKLVHSLGVSGSDNVMRGESMFSQYQTGFGPVNLTFRDSIIPSASFTLSPVVGLVSNVAEGQKFDTRRSLYNLTPVFRKPLEKVSIGNSVGVMPAYTRGNVISYTPLSKELNSLNISHEMNHVMFWDKLRFCDDLVNLVPTEKVHPKLEMENITRWWNLGQDVGAGLMWLPFRFNSGAYYYIVPEVEAYSVQRQ